MKRLLMGGVVFFALALTINFLNPVYAAENNDQKTIYVLFDDGVSGNLDARQAKAQAQLSDWMDDDLVRVFARYAKAGYQAKMIEKRGDFRPGSNNYLLAVKIIEYRAGSKAARIVVGFGAGGVSLKIHYELSANGRNVILTSDDGVFSGREWISAARKLNEKMAKAVTEKLRK